MPSPSGRQLPVADPEADIRFRKEMGITREEFLRALSGAFGERCYRIHQDEVFVTEAGRRIAISLSEQDERRLGALRLPRLRVDFIFSGFGRNEAEAFMTDLEVRFQRGGG